MADTKISSLAAVTDMLATDEYVLARSGATKKIAASDLAAAISGDTSAWQSFTPSFTTPSGSPALGNAVVDCAYRLVGKTLQVRFHITFGNTTNFGSGQFRFGLPGGVTPKTGPRQAFQVLGLDSGSQWRIGAGIIESAASYFTINTGASGTSDWQSTVPQTWTTSDAITATYTIEVD